MSYDTTILADSPVLYHKIEEEEGASSLADSSGNSRDGAVGSAGTYTLGIAGPIETDAASHGADGAPGYYYTASIAGTATDLVTAFTWEGWAFYDGSAQLTLISRNGLVSLNGSNFLMINSGVPRARVSTGTGGANTYDVNAAAAVAEGYWHHLVATRSGTTLRLYVNGILAAERTDLPGGAISYGNYNDSSWKWGGSTSTASATTGAGGVFPSAGVSRIALYNTALSAARVLAHYEAAKNNLPLSLTFESRARLEIETDQLLPKTFGFSHNYGDAIGGGHRPVRERLSWRTHVMRSEPDYVQRAGAEGQNVGREIFYQVTPRAANARARLHALLDAPGEFYAVPFVPDAGALTAQASAGASSLSLDTTKRDYRAEGYVGVCTNWKDPSTYQFFKISAVADAALTIYGTVGTTVASGSPVFPAVVCSLPADEVSYRSHARDFETGAFEFESVPATLGRRATAYTPASTYKSIEVFSLASRAVPWVQEAGYSTNRRQQIVGGDYGRAVDTASARTIPVRFLTKTRAELSELFGWLDARRGRRNPVWVFTDEADFEVTATTGTTLTVTDVGYTANYNLHHGRRDIVITKTDGSLVFRRITACADNGSTETLTMASHGVSTATIARVSLLRYCTLAADVVELVYSKNGSGDVICETELSFRELLFSPA